MSKLSARSPLRLPLLNMWKEAEATTDSDPTTDAIEPYSSGPLIFAFAGGIFTVGLLSWCVHWSKKNRKKSHFTQGEKVCWGDLPQDLLCEIGKRLDGRIDILRFRSACKKWRSSLPAPNRFPFRVPPPPSVDRKHSDAPFFITEVDNYQIHKFCLPLVFQELVQHATYQRIDYPNIVKWDGDNNRVSFMKRHRVDDNNRVSFMKPHRVSLLCKAYHIRMANNMPPNERGFYHFQENNYTTRTVIISSDANGVNPSYASMSDLSVVALLKSSRLALLRLGASHLTWDTDFCCEKYTAIGVYKGKLCALDILGRLFLMDYNSLQMTPVAVSPLPYALSYYFKYLFEFGGELCMVDWGRSYDNCYKLNMRRKKWIRVRVSSNLKNALMAFYFSPSLTR